MTASVSTPVTAPELSAVPVWLLKVCFAVTVVNLIFCPVAYFSHWWIYDPNGVGIPTDFINVWAAGRLALEGYELVSDADAEKDGMLRVIDESGEDYLFPASHFVLAPLPSAVEEAVQHAVSAPG